MIINPFESNNNDSDILSLKEEKTSYNDDVSQNIINYIIDNYQEIISKEKGKKQKEKIIQIIKEQANNYYIDNKNNIDEIVKKIINKFFGYYILQEYIDNEEISDIRVIAYNNIFCKIRGEWKKQKNSFKDENDYLNFVRNTIIKNGGKINNENPICVVSDKENNLRIEAGINPVNIFSPNLVIRIHRKSEMDSLEGILLSNSNMMDCNIYSFLNSIIKNEANILISGKGGSGKTTLLRALINKLPSNISITSNEETLEIFANHSNIIQREIIQNRTKEKNITLEMLVKECLVMSNDAIAVGELKGEETMSFVDAVFTGHIGYATVHSNSASNTITRMVTLMKKDSKAVQYTSEYLEQILCSSVDFIIFMKNFKIYEIMEISYDYINKLILRNIIYQYNEINNGGYFVKKNKLKYRLKDKIKDE